MAKQKFVGTMVSMAIFNIKNRFKNKVRNMLFKEDGFSLLLVLLATGVIAGVFSSILFYKTDVAIQKQAHAAGWHAFEVAKATRVFVRNANLDPFVLTNGITCCTDANVQAQGGFINIPFQDLINAGHLPANFANITPLGQQLSAFAGSYPLVTNPQTLGFPIAGYVLSSTAGGSARAGQVADVQTASSMMLGAREAGLSSSAPLIIGGVNQSEDCNPGDPALIIWDTGCIGQNEFNAVAGFGLNEGDLLVPTWRSIDHDLRALMRYEQPENVGANTMLTDLHMGDATDFAANPDAVGADNRVNINNLNGLDISSLVLADQAAIADLAGSEDEKVRQFGVGNLAFTELVISVAGNVNAAQNFSAGDVGAVGGGSAVVDGDLRATSGLTATDLMVANAIEMNGNAIGFNANSITINNATTQIARSTFSNTGQITQLNIGGVALATNPQVIADSITNLESLDVQGIVTAFNNIAMSGGTVNVTGGNNYMVGAVPFDVRAGSIENIGNIVTSAATDVQFESGAGINRLDTRRVYVNQCSGDCVDETTNNPIDVTP
ncbi:MAG: hypothetical protein CMP22_07990 [Rickettsiales bacterium]|nr:hypothetical protein [Rickettsiales bacterium]|tara:strand:+ start:111 stop:1766 length:1656 start_codon:yes stop_codon:yes gene_type:complete